MADEPIAVAIDMVDGVSQPAEAAATALAKLQNSINSDTKALNELQRTMRQLKAAGREDTGEIKRLETAMKGLKERIAQTKEKFIAQGGQFGRNYKGAKDLKSGLAELSKAASVLPGPLGSAIGFLQRFITASSIGKFAAVALAAGIVAIGVAAVAGGKKLADFALAAQEARRNELLMLEASTKLRTVTSMAFGLPADKAQDLQAAVDKVSASVSIGRDEVAKYAASLEKSGVRGKNFESALQAVSTAASGWGEERANETLQWASSLALTGGNVDKLAQRVQSQIGGVVKKQMLSSEVQARKLGESYNSLFGNVDVEPLLKARKGFNDLFSQATSSGQALKRILGMVTQPLVDGLTVLSRMFKIFVQDTIYALLLAENAWLKFQLALQAGIAVLRKMFPNALKAFDALTEGIDKLWQMAKSVFGDEWKEVLGAAALVLTVTFAPALWAAASAMLGFAAGAVAAGVAAAGAILAVAWPFIATVAAVYLLIKAVELLWDLFTTEDWGQLGIQIIDGIAAGLTKAKDVFVNMLGGIAKAGIAGFKSIFGMASPSKVMAELGINVVKGLEQGVDDESSKAEAAIAGAGGDPSAAVPKGAAAGRMGTTISIAQLNVEVGPGASKSDARSIADAIKRELETILETVAVQTGAVVP